MLERFRELEMWNRIDGIDEIRDEHSHLSDVFAKTELYHEDSAIDLIQQHEEWPILRRGICLSHLLLSHLRHLLAFISLKTSPLLKGLIVMLAGP